MLLRNESSVRFWRALIAAIILGLSIVGSSYIYAQSEDIEEINQKAEKYFEFLSENPSGDYLYDRFYDAWLDTGTVEGLEQYLKENISKSSGISGHLLLAYFYERQGNDKDALEHFEEASVKEPKPEVLYQKASVESRLQEFDSAISDLLEANKVNEDKELSIKISKLLAKLYIRTDKKDSAAEVWGKLIQSNPDDEDIYEDMIELQISEGLYDQAIETSDQLLKITKDSYKTIMRQLRKADIYQYSGKNEQALEIYKDTIALVGQGTWLENQICSQVERVYHKQDDIRSLQGFWEKIIKDEPQRVSIKKRLAQLLLQFNEVDDALNLYQEIVRVTPGDKANQQAYIGALRSVSQTSKAIELMEQLCKQNPDDRELLIDLADLYYLNRDKDAVVETLQKFLDKSDKSEYVFTRVARILENYNYKEKVFDVFEKLLIQYPDSLTAKEAYAEILYKYDNKDKAIELWHSLALAGDFQTLLRVSKSASSRGSSELALEWLEARYNEFENDILYMNQLCEVAIRLGLYDKAQPWVQKQLMMADRSSLIQAAIRQKIQLDKYSGTISETMENLKAQDVLSVQETCLLSELMEYNKLSKEAQGVLDDFLVDVNNFNIDDAARKTQKEIAIHQKIHLYSVNKKWEQAAECTKKLIAMKGTQDSAYVLELINLYEKAGQWELALDWIPAWKRASPGSTEPILAESRILRRLYKIDTAIERLRAAEQVFENNQDILSELVSLYRSYNRPAEAYRITWRLYDEAEDPSTKLGYVRDLAVISRSMGNMESLIEKLKEQRANNRTSVVPLLALSEVYRQAEKFEERLQVLMEATRLRPNDIALLNEIARIEESEGLWEQAIETLQQALPLDATNSTKQKLARLYIQYGNEEEGYRLLFDFDNKVTTDPLEVQTVVRALISETNWDMAEKYLAEVLPQFPDDYRLHYLYGICLQENGKYQDALEKFVQIIGMKTEVPGIASQNTVPQQPSYIEQLAKIAPPGVAEIISLQQVFSRALSYSREYDNLPYWYYPNNSRQTININIPQKVEEVPGFAISQIFSILNNDSMLETSEIDSQLRETTLKRVLQENNFSALEFIIDAKNFNFDNLSTSIIQMASEYPDNEALQGFWVIYYSSSSNLNRDEKHVRHVFDMFKETYPSLSCMLGLMYGAGNEAGSDLFEQSLKMLSKIDKPEEYLMSRIIQIVRSQNVLVTQEQKTILADKLMNWYEELRSDPSQNTNRNEISYSLLSALFFTGEKESLIKILNQEVESYKNNPNQTQSNASSSQTDVRIQGLRYPPTYNLPEIPSSLSSIAYQILREGGLNNNKLFDSNNIDEFISQLEEPLLKAVMYIAANQNDKALEILESKLKTEPNSISAYIIVASILASQNKQEEAILELAKIQSLNPDASMQLIVDGAIVSYVRNINITQSPKALNAAQEAAMRLTKGQFTQSGYRDMLIEAMNYLGLGDEARLFATRYTPNTSSRGIRNIYNIQGLQQQAEYQQLLNQGRIISGRTQDLSTIQYNKIVDLLQNDKADAAIRLLITDLKTIAGESLLPERFNNNNSNVRNRIALVHSNNLEDRIIELANPAPSKNVRQMLIYARICDLIDRKDEAKRAYEKILEFRPKEFGALLWLAFDFVEKDPDKAVKYLMEVDRRYSNQLGRQISNYIQNNYNNQENFENIFNYTSMATFYLKSLKDTNSIDLSWAANIPNILARSYSRNNIRLPQLYVESQVEAANMVLSRGRNAIPNQTSSEEVQKLIEKRRQVHNDFCKAMLQIPQLAAQGFACLHSEARARNAVDDSIATMALDALLKYNSTRNYSNGGLISSYNWGTGKEFRLLSPMEFLLYYNWKNGTLDEFIGKVTPVLEKNNRVSELKQLKLYASLYKATAENYISQANAFLESGIISGSSSPYGVINKQNAINQIMEIRSDRSLKVSMNKFLIGMIDINTLNSIYQVQETIRVYLTQLTKEDPESANEFLEEVVTVFLGPKEKRKEFIAQNYNQGRSSNNVQGQRVQLCVNLLRNMVQNGDLLFTVLSQFEDLDSYISDMRYYVQNGIDNVIQRAISSSSQSSGNTDDFTKLISMLNDSPFLTDVNSFRTLPVTQLQKSSVYSYMLYRFWRTQSSQYENMRTMLRQTLSNSLSQKTGNAGFGTELLIAQLSDNRRLDVYNCLVKYWEQFQKLDTARQQEISVMVCDTVGLTSLTDSSLSGDLKIIVAQLNKLRQDASQEKVNSFLEKKHIEDFNQNDSQFYEYASNIVNSLASYDVDASVKLVLKSIEIMEDARKRGKLNQSYTDRQFISNILSKMQQDRGSGSFGSIGFLIKMCRDSNELTIGSIEPYYSNQFDSTIYDRYRQLRGTSNNNQFEALKSIYNELGPNLGKGNLSGINIFRRLFDSGNWNEQLINDAISWSNEQIKSDNYPDLARLLAANASLYKQRRFMNRSSRNGTSSSDNSILEAEQYYMDSLTDSNLPVQWRLMANYSMIQNLSSMVSDKLVKQAVELIIKGWKLYPDLNAEYCTNTINRFIDILVPDRNQQGNRSQFSSGAAVSNEPVITKAEWTDTATRFSDAYLAFRQPAPVSISSTVRSQPSNYEGNSTIQLAMLEINLLLDRDDAVRAMLDGFDSRAGTYIECWALLVKYNKPELLKSVVEKQWSNSIHQAGNFMFNKEIEKNLPGCLDAIQSDDLKFLAQVLISSLPDDGRNEQRPTMQRNERLTNFAGKIGDITFNSVQVKQRILEIYINETQLMPLVAEHLAEEGKKINLNTLITSQDSNLVRTQSQLIVAYCISNVLKGDPNVFIQTIHACETFTSSNQSQPLGARQVSENLGRQLSNISETIRNKWTEEQISSLATASAEFIASSGVRYYSPNRLLSDLVVYHVLAKRENEITAALEKVNYEIRQNLRNYLNLSEMNSSLARFTRERNLTLEERIDIIKRFYQTDPVQDAMERDNSRDMLSYLTNYNVLTRQEIDQNRGLLKDLFIQTKKIDAFLKTSNLKEININESESQFRQYVTSLLNSTMWEDAELCRKVLLKAKSLFIESSWSSESRGIYQANPGRGGEQIWSGNQFISNILLQRDSSTFSYADIGIIVDLTRDANGPQIVLTQEYLQRISSIIGDRYRQSLREFNQNQLEAVKAFYSQIGPYFGKGNASGYSMFWASVLQASRGSSSLEQIKEWANEQVDKGEYPNIAKEISFILMQQTNLPVRGIRGITPASGDSEEKIRKYYLDVLADPKLSAIWRLMALEEYRKRSRFESNLNDENADIVFKAIPIVIEGFNQYPDLHDTYYMNIINAFAKLQDRPNWKELAGKLSEAYELFRSGGNSSPDAPPQTGEVTFLQGRGGLVISAASASRESAFRDAIAARGRTSGRTVDPNAFFMGGTTWLPDRTGTVPANSSPTMPVQQTTIDPVELSMLEIRLALNEDELIKKQLNNPGSSLGQSLDVWALLAQHGRDSMLKDVIIKNWQRVSLNSNLPFTKDLESSVARCLKEIPNDNMRYFAEVVLSSLSDSKEQNKVPLVSHKERMTRLAEKYSTVDFRDYILKQRILALMINEPDALKYLGDSLAEQVANIELNTLFANFDNSARERFNLVLANSCENLLKGDPNNFVRMVKSVTLNTSGSNRSLERELLSVISENLTKTADCTKSNWSAAQMAAFGAASTELFAQNSFSINNSNNLFINHYIFFILGQKSDELQNSYRRFNSWAVQMVQNMQRYERLPEYYAQLSGYLINRNLSFEQRLDIIDRFNNADWITDSMSRSGRSIPNINIVQLFIDRRIFSKQETIDNASSFSEFVNPAIKNFLNIKSIAELGSNPSPLDITVNNLVTSVTINDTDLIIKIILKAEELNQQIINSSGGDSPFGRNSICSRIISQLFQQETNRLQVLNVIIKLMRDSKDLNIFPDSSLYQIDRQIVTLFTQLPQYQTNKLDALKDIYQQIGQFTGKGNASGISGIFSVLFSEQQWRDNELLDSIIQWSHEQAQTGDYPLLAQEIEIMAIAYRNRPVFGMTSDKEKVKPVIEYYQKVLDDESLPLSWRLMTIHAMENWVNYPDLDPLANHAVTILAKCSDQSPMFSWDLHSTVLNRFIHSAHDFTSEGVPQNNYDFAPVRTDWADIASKALDSYMKYRAKQNDMPRSFQGRVGARQSASISELVMLEVSLLLKEEETTKQLLNDSNGSLKTSSCSLSLLVEYQENSLLKEFVENNIENIKLDNRGIYNSQLEDRINESLKNVSREDVQYLVKLYLYAHNDRNYRVPFSEQTGPLSTRQQRLKILAEQFNKIEFENKNLKKNALTYLVQETSVLPYISKALSEEAQKINLASMSSASKQNVYIFDSPDFQIYLSDKMNMLMNGDPKGFEEILNYSRSIYSSDRNLSDNIPVYLISSYLRVVTGTDWDVKKLPAYLAVSDELLSSLHNDRGFNSSILQLICCKVALLLINEKSSTNISRTTQSEIDSTFNILIPYQQMFRNARGSIAQIRSTDTITSHQVMARYMNSSGMDFDQRVAFLKKLYSIRQIAGVMNEPGSNSMLSILSNTRIFSMEEIINHADILMSLPPATQNDWQFLAFFQSREGKLDDAEKTWRKAVEMGMKAEAKWAGMSDYMNFLNSNNLRDKALEYWRSFDTKSMSLKSLVEYHDLIQSLSNQI